jgi:hypothetical protein
MAISSERLSLFILIDGPRGSQKTLRMTANLSERLVRALYWKQLHGKVKHVWANYPVGFWWRSEIDKKPYYLKPEPLNMEALYTFDDDFIDGWAFIDEIDQWYDRQDWQAVTQKLMNAAFTQIRKSKLTVEATIQDADWINSRGQFQLDILSTSREAAFTPWGRKMGLDLGEASNTAWKDMSGVMTGYKYKETGLSYKATFWLRRFWNCYDTYYRFDPTETKVRYSLKVPRKTIELGEGGYKVLKDNVDSLESLSSEKKDKNLIILADIVQSFIDEGVGKINTGELWGKAYPMGFEGDTLQGGRLLSRLGVTRHKQYYLLPMSNIDNDGGDINEEAPLPPEKVSKKSPVKASKK